MKNDDESKTNKIKRANKNITKTMRQLRLRINHKKLTKKNKAKKKFSVLLTKEEVQQKINYFKKIYGTSSSYQICLQALYYTPYQRTVELNNMIIYYLRNLKNFRHLFSDLKEEEFENVLFNISTHLTYEKYNKNEMICKYGDKADKYYIVLKGKVIFLVPQMNKYYMTEEDYIEHLMKLRENQEYELLKSIISINQYIYYINGNNNNNTNNNSSGNNFDLDEFIFNAIERHEINKENKYSDYLYYKFKEYINNIEKEINDNDDNNNILKKKNITKYEEYIELCNVKISNRQDKKSNKRKLVTILEYQKTIVFNEGDAFGETGISNKKCKRTATCISSENCHLGILTKNEYFDFLQQTIEKINNKIYDLVMKNNIFENMIMNKFVMKYSHMFRFIQYNKNNMIISEKEKINSLIILYQGEFSISVNTNLFELNELIIEYKKIKNKLNNETKYNFQEIEENKKLLINMKDLNKDIKDIIIGKHNFIISNISNKLILGYPNTVNPESNISFINCQCVSNYANAYIIEKDLLKLIDKENNFTRKTPDIIISKIDLILKRLDEFKLLILKKIKDKKQNKTNGIIDNDKNNNIKIISRNFKDKINKNKTNLVDFNQKVISPGINKNKLFLSQPSLCNDKEEKLFLITKLKKDISDKEILLNKAQQRSRKFMIGRRNEFKNIIKRDHKKEDREKYNDLSLIFSDKPHHKITILDKFKNILEQDNVLDPQIKKLKMNKFKMNLKLVKEKNLEKNIDNNKIPNKTNTNISNSTDKTFSSFYKIFCDNIKTETKFNFDDINDTFTSFYTKNSTIFNLQNKLVLNPSGKNIHNINLNDRNIKCLNNNYQESYNELLYKYIYDKYQRKEKNNNDIHDLNIDGYKAKTLNTSPNKYIFPSINPFTPDKLKKKDNICKFKFISVSKSKNINI